MKKIREVDFTALHEDCLGQRVSRLRVWPRKELQSQEQSRKSCLRSHLPNTLRDGSLHYHSPTNEDLFLWEKLSPRGHQGPWQL